MKSFRLFVGGLVAALSLSAVPAFADHGSEIKLRVKGSWNSEGGEHGYRAKSHFNEKLEARVLELVNQVRERRGLNDMRDDFRAQKSAREIAAEAGREGGFGDIRFGLRDRLEDQGLETRDRQLGEARVIVELDDDSTVELVARQVVKSWLRSSKFSRVLLSEDLTYGGVAAFVIDGEVTFVLDAFGAQPVRTPPPSCGGY